MCLPALPRLPFSLRSRICLALVLAFTWCGALRAAVGGRWTRRSLRSQFANPPRQYSSAPLWVWNDMLTEEQIVGTLRDLAGQKVKQVVRPSAAGPDDAVPVATTGSGSGRSRWTRPSGST